MWIKHRYIHTTNIAAAVVTTTSATTITNTNYIIINNNNNNNNNLFPLNIFPVSIKGKLYNFQTNISALFWSIFVHQISTAWIILS
jgi:hypothetical protein